MSDHHWRPLLRSALAILALPPSEQINAFRPEWDLPFELLDDFDNARHAALANAGDLSEQQVAILDQINEAIEEMQPKDFESYKSEVVFRPAWQKVRDVAQFGLKVFGWENVVVRPATESAPGVWSGPSTD
jgi:hypothetical protein